MSDSEDENEAVLIEIPESSNEVASQRELNVIWEDDKIEKYTDHNGKQHWKCLWCGRSFQHWNATKALFHVNKEPGAAIRSCPATKIDDVHKAEYRRLFNKLHQRKTSHAHFLDGKKRTSDEYMSVAAELYADTKRRKTPPSASSSSISTAINRPPNQIQTQLTFATEQPNESQILDTHRSFQPKVTDNIDSQNEARLTMAIADLIHSCGLPFSLASHHKFQRVLTCAKLAPKNYTPPNRNLVAGKLLDLNYEIYKDQTTEMLLKEADIYGLTFFGDGATIRKSPLMNILASSIHEPAGCLSIVDCTGHMESDGRKDASYIASLFVPHIKSMEERTRKCTDLIIFDGASNVQKAGSLLEAQFPHVSVIHGAEHVVSLFFSDIFRLTEFDMLKRLNQSIYRYFGSGSMHSFYALFSKHSRDHNQGKSIGLIRAADTRMGGHVISMIRTLRLKDPLINTMSSASFLQANTKIEKKYIDLLKSDTTWEIMSKLVRAVFPLLIVLRLCDQQEPFMDKLYYYVRRMDESLVKSKAIVDEVEKTFKKISWRAIKEMNSREVSSDNEESEVSEFDSETCADDDSDMTTTLGQKIIDVWNKRRIKLVNDFTIAGWLLSPIPVVYIDSNANSNGEHRNAVDRLLKKMYCSELSDDSEEFARLFNVFWEEYEYFKSKTGPFSKLYIWKESNPDLQNGRSYMWHKKNSLPFTTIFGKFACRVCSKIVGMGSAERNWGDVKHLKSDKRSHLSSEAVQKQATIFGASCMLNARLERDSKRGTFEDPYKFWNDEDFDGEFSWSSNPKTQTNKSRERVFKCYLEDWEKEHLHRKGDISKAKFLQKYGGLEFDDVDDPVHYWIDDKELHFQKRTKHEEGGWCVLATSDSPPADSDDDASDVDGQKKKKFHKWSIAEDAGLFDCIANYYMHHPEKNVKLVLRKGQAKEIQSLIACGGCGRRSTPHHKCDKCKKNMHITCGRVIGEVRERSRVRCPQCDGKSVAADASCHRIQEKVPRSGHTNLAPCGGCGKDVGPVHKCDICQQNMHPFCGRTIGEEGHGAPVRCPNCDNKRRNVTN